MEGILYYYDKAVSDDEAGGMKIVIQWRLIASEQLQKSIFSVVRD